MAPPPPRSESPRAGVPSGAAAQPLVLVPGLLCDALMWAPQVEGLADVADCWIMDNTRHDTIEDMARAALAECPFERFSLAGLSMGGYVAQAMWRQAPDRVERLALLDTNAVADPPAAAAGRRALIAAAGTEGLSAVASALMPRLVWPHARRMQALAAIIRTMARNTTLDAFRRQQTAIMGRIDGRAYLAKIACPVLIACGANDILTPPAQHKEMAARLPGAVLKTFAGCGHLSTLEQPFEVNRALRAWLSQ